jgi:hypothetical protein
VLASNLPGIYPAQAGFDLALFMGISADERQKNQGLRWKQSYKKRLGSCHCTTELRPRNPLFHRHYWLAEAVATFGLVLTIFGGVARSPTAVPYAVSLYITSAYWFTASTSFANPAVMTTAPETFPAFLRVGIAPGAPGKFCRSTNVSSIFDHSNSLTAKARPPGLHGRPEPTAHGDGREHADDLRPYKGHDAGRSDARECIRKWARDLELLRPNKWGKHRKIDVPHHCGVLVIGDADSDKPKNSSAASVKARKWKAAMRMIRKTKA